MRTTHELDQKMIRPSDQLIQSMADMDGDLMILGVGGKMGPSLAKLAKKAIEKAGVEKKVIGVSRFSAGSLQEELQEAGIETIAADLLNDKELQSLPAVKNVIFMAGQKFGTTGNESLTWAMNTYLPGRVAEKFRESRIVSFSTGNIYPLSAVLKGGSSEDAAVGPVGEYAQSCLGRERIFSYFSQKYDIPMLHFRLNYAIDMKYGVLLEIAKSVYERRPLDLSMGQVNVIWQGDANEMAIRSLELCTTPPQLLNITGPETTSVRWLAEQFAARFHVEPVFVNQEKDTALLSNASKSHQLLGYPRVSLGQMIDWTAEWVAVGGETSNKPTHFQERKGEF
ncbi:epimerase [Brevibacillus reuszeri]|uniref:Epimerase n=1 Tax=Brevibacillus reuszeri TaxID=54915 RepID=A0A0K9YQU2_9BACL|nr:NAD-dependent epimerase/dehydratase family protein [Brevibacillus reuszeri]KNB70550.1 epimerase [Brevibacillus reuszeri]MED1861483.1 NAD-dependent epimerase/dehydratase family protein [Brevibacillus reuszeri]GED70029.1 epimerase [Brevibacillus reuszeri]